MLSESIANLCNSLSCVGYRGDHHTNILIKETDKLAKLKNITLDAPNGDWLSFTPDKGRTSLAKMSPLLATGAAHKHHCACDSVILVMRNNQLTVLYIDLKSDNPVGYANQFKSTRQFMRYLLGLLEEFYNLKLPIFEERYIVLHTRKNSLLIKKPTTPNLEKLKNTKPDNAFKREVTNNDKIYLKELLD